MCLHIRKKHEDHAASPTFALSQYAASQAPAWISLPSRPSCWRGPSSQKLAGL